MSAILGVLLIAIGIVSFQLACRVFQRPHPPRWVRAPLAAEVVTLSMVGLIAFGVGLVIRLLAHLDETPFGLLEGALLLAIVAASVVLVRFLARQPKATPPAEASKLDPREPPRSVSGGRKRAA